MTFDIENNFPAVKSQCAYRRSTALSTISVPRRPNKQRKCFPKRKNVSSFFNFHDRRGLFHTLLALISKNVAFEKRRIHMKFMNPLLEILQTNDFNPLAISGTCQFRFLLPLKWQHVK